MNKRTIYAEKSNEIIIFEPGLLLDLDTLINTNIHCPNCNGTGLDSYERNINDMLVTEYCECPTCNGRGYIPFQEAYPEHNLQEY